MNQQAKKEFENACTARDLATAAADAGDINSAVAWTGIASVTMEIANFVVENHALVRGIDEDFPDITKPTQDGPKVWGPAPIPSPAFEGLPPP